MISCGSDGSYTHYVHRWQTPLNVAYTVEIHLSGHVQNKQKGVQITEIMFG